MGQAETCPVGVIDHYFAGVTTGFATGATAALVDLTAFLFFFTFWVVTLVSGVTVLGASCLTAPKAEAAIIERASTEVIASFMVCRFLF